ncbi:MAG: alpha-L-rhamnosidase [Clostridia bacterium]|nr:alpha-L-rhamnosidase [Clostridia bacterium]
MKSLDRVNFGTADNRVRRDVYPVRIVKCFGNIENAEALLDPKPAQITIDEPVLTIMKNDGDEEAAIILDYGVELNGGLRIVAFGVEGTDYANVRVTFGESVSEALCSIGEKGATNDHTPRDFFATVPAYSDQTVGETGFRFVCIRLKGEKTALSLKSLNAVFVYNDIEYKGSFCCNDELLNNIYDTAAYTCHLNMQRYIWDGIKRDRLVWVGDMHPEMLTIKTVFGYHNLMTETIRFARETTPLPKFMNSFATYSIWWLRILWDWYYYGGDKEFLLENKEYALGLIRQLSAYVKLDGSDTFDFKFLDWPTSISEAGAQGVKGLLASGLMDFAKLANEYGETELAEECMKKLNAMRKRKFQNHGAKQTAAFLALSGLDDADSSAEMILNGGAKGMSTFMSYYILTAAAKKSISGALDMLREYYGGMLKVGATSFWEDFNIEWLNNAAPIDDIVPEGKSDIHGDNGAFCYEGFRHSLCHGWSSGPTAFLAEKVLGIEIAEAGCKKIKISPNLGDLKWAKGTYPTPLGIITVSHKKEADGSISTEYTAPEGIEIELC